MPDIVDYKLRIIRNNILPFGGMKLAFLGDPCQMEPVVEKSENIKLDAIYPDNGGDYNFYKAHVMQENNFFVNTFDIFQLNQDYRHKDDILFRNMLSNIRLGNITDKQLEIVNARYDRNIFYNEDIQYLTVSNSKAESINKIFFDKINSSAFCSTASFRRINQNYESSIEDIKNPFKKELHLKKNMRVMFVKNDHKENGRRWVNGTIGKIEEISATPEGVIVSVFVNAHGKIYKVLKERYDLNVFSKEENEFINAGTIEQFPFIPAYAITIDKSQGLTLDKIAVVMGNNHRDNQIYVALSRARRLGDVTIFGRRIEKRDIRLSSVMKMFLRYLDEKSVAIEHSDSINAIAIFGNNNSTIVINAINKIIA
jgi:hypothetical protein